MNTCVVGLQWGDEGKGKVVDLLAERADVVVRYSGGANAGHTVIRQSGEKAFALHLLPSGILHPETLCVIANGVVVDAEILGEELKMLSERGVDAEGQLRISGRAHLVMDYHKLQDRLSEEALGKEKIGTTIRGIGPCYADKVTRTTAVRVIDLLDLDSLRNRLERIVDYKNRLFAAIYPGAEPIVATKVYEKCCAWAEQIGPFIADTTALLQGAWREGKTILFEGAQGTLLDLDHGTFPFVTSSNAGPGGLGAVSGLPGKAVDRYLGVTKAYSTRVGAGPFPTELDNEIGQQIRDRGHEYGTTTGRPRRCGWFDSVVVRYSVGVGGIDGIALQHLDTLSGLKELKICTHYRVGDKRVEFFPAERRVLEQAVGEYETLEGFTEDVSGAQDFEQLPAAAKRYVERVEQIVGAPVVMVGVGPSRQQTLMRHGFSLS